MNNCIYRFKNKENKIIYIGKAKELNKRLNTHTHLPKECYEELEVIEYISLNTMDDTDLAERYFISKYKPKYNEIFKNRNITFNIFFLDRQKWIVLEKSKFYNSSTFSGLREEIIMGKRAIANRITIELEDDKHLNPVPKSIRINEFIYQEWQEFCEGLPYSKMDLISMALKEYMEKYK